MIHDKVVVMTGGSRGIGEEILLKLAEEKVKVIIIAAKTVMPHKTLKGTIHSVAEKIEKLGVEAIPFQLDVTDHTRIQKLMKFIDKRYGRIDILINNASAMLPRSTLETTMKQFDLVIGVNVRGTFAMSQAAIPLLMKSDDPQILNMSPPINLNSPWLEKNLAYAYSKMGMTFCTLGMSREFADIGIRVNSLWPKGWIATAAVKVNFPDEVLRSSYHARIMADAAWEIFTNEKFKKRTGKVFIDQVVLIESGKGYCISDYRYTGDGSEFVRKGAKLKVDQFKFDLSENADLSDLSKFRRLKSKL